MITSIRFRFLFCPVLVLIAVSVHAQGFRLSNFHENPTDMTAATSGVKDLNGRAAALIRFVVRAPQFEFDANMGVIKTEKRTGEVWVYVPHGTKRLTVRHPYLGVVRDFEPPVAIKSKTTYDVELVVLDRAYMESLYRQQQNGGGSITVNVDENTSSHTATITVEPLTRTLSVEQSSATEYQDHIFTVKGVTFKMIAIEGGTFTMGATSEQGSEAWDDEKPAHSVTLNSYSIGETEVAQALWQTVMGSNPSCFSGENKPVEQVSWDDCQDFIRRLNALTGENFRLPTEAEWEYAARGGNKSQRYKYAGNNTIDDVAWYSGNSTHNIGTKSPNELGLYDMSGDVWEWCQDWYGNYSSNSQTNPTGPATGNDRVLRGGSWFSSARNCRVSYRYYSASSFRGNRQGLRLAL